MSRAAGQIGSTATVAQVLVLRDLAFVRQRSRASWSDEW
jgi:hypothetical protein